MTVDATRKATGSERRNDEGLVSSSTCSKSWSPGLRAHPGGPGNPHAAKVAKLRSTLLDAATPEDMRAVLDALITEAKAGNVPAMREFFNRILGQPQAVDAIERLAEVEAVLERLETTTAAGDRP